MFFFKDCIAYLGHPKEAGGLEILMKAEDDTQLLLYQTDVNEMKCLPDLFHMLRKILL